MITLRLSAITLALAAACAAQDIKIDAGDIVHPVSPYLTGACIEDVNHEIYGGIYSQMIFGESFQEPDKSSNGVSGMWSAVRSDGVSGGFSIDREDPFVGAQSQEITFHGGAGKIGVANSGLNRWGMYFSQGKPYEGSVWARAEKPSTLIVSLESRDGSSAYAAQSIAVSGRNWKRFDFVLTPNGTDKSGRFVISLKSPGSMVIGHAFLQPGEWGRFKGLPVRKDVAEALMAEGPGVLRYGGSMVNAPEYRWKHMIGPRHKRPPYKGTWYPFSSDGWGIFDFLDFCQAAGIEAIPDFNIDESPADMAEFARRAKAWHLTHLELGNEEAINETYWEKFKPLAEAIWAANPDMIIVVGDFYYHQAIVDPFHFSGGSVPTLAAQKKILDLAKAHDREVWFDVHVDTEAPPAPDLSGVKSFIEQLGIISPGAKYRVAIFELNANNHAMRRALANASGILQAECMSGRLAVVCSANCLQPDGQNDNGWDQGLLFLNPSQTWLQPPGSVAQMISQNYEPLLIKSTVTSSASSLDVVALRNQEANTVVLQVVNTGAEPIASPVHLTGIDISQILPAVTQLTAPLNAVNTASSPDAVKPTTKTVMNGEFSFPAHSFSIIRWAPQHYP